MVHAPTARLAQCLSQSRANDLAGLKLESRDRRTDDWDTKLRPRQNKRIGGDTARLQSVENMLEASSRSKRKFCRNRIRPGLWLQ